MVCVSKGANLLIRRIGCRACGCCSPASLAPREAGVSFSTQQRHETLVCWEKHDRKATMDAVGVSRFALYAWWSARSACGANGLQDRSKALRRVHRCSWPGTIVERNLPCSYAIPASDLANCACWRNLGPAARLPLPERSHHRQIDCQCVRQDASKAVARQPLPTTSSCCSPTSPFSTENSLTGWCFTTPSDPIRRSRCKPLYNPFAPTVQSAKCYGPIHAMHKLRNIWHFQPKEDRPCKSTLSATK